MNSNINWKFLTLPFNIAVREALVQQHHAAQFIALAGHHLIQQKPDDSNTNMGYYADKEWLLGRELSGGFQLALHLSDLKLILVDKNLKGLVEISLSGKTKKQVFEELKQMLADAKIDVSNFVDELHYEMPSHALDKGAPFSDESKEALKENSLYRQNADMVLNKIVSQYKNSDPLRIWPHHFDTGSLLPLGYNSKGGISKSLGLGWAMPDTMVNEPYFYLSFWSENPIGDFKDLPSPDAGEWIRTGWKGGIARQSDIIKLSSSELQEAFVETFFSSGIKILGEHLKL